MLCDIMVCLENRTQFLKKPFILFLICARVLQGKPVSLTTPIGQSDISVSVYVCLGTATTAGQLKYTFIHSTTVPSLKMEELHILMEDWRNVSESKYVFRLID